jgi:hypothetical protein
VKPANGLIQENMLKETHGSAVQFLQPNILELPAIYLQFWNLLVPISEMN